MANNTMKEVSKEIQVDCSVVNLFGLNEFTS